GRGQPSFVQNRHFRFRLTFGVFRFCGPFPLPFIGRFINGIADVPSPNSSVNYGHQPRAAHWVGELTVDPQVEPVSLAVPAADVQPPGTDVLLDSPDIAGEGDGGEV